MSRVETKKHPRKGGKNFVALTQTYRTKEARKEKRGKRMPRKEKFPKTQKTGITER
nr:MAG TPA: hypothetical protein [Caudoviricetes sp.]